MGTPEAEARLVLIAVYLNSEDCRVWAQIGLGALFGAACMLCLLTAIGWGP